MRRRAAGDESSTGDATDPLRGVRSNLPSEARVPTGVPGLDELVGGGFPRHRTVLIGGDIGTGKTTFGLQFLVAGAARGEAGVLVSVDEKPQHVIEDARRFGWDVDGAVDRRLLTVLDASPFFMALRARSALDARHVASDLAQQVRHAKASRLVIDGVTSLAPAAADAAAVEDFIRSLILSLEDNLECTTILTTRTTAGAEPSVVGSSAERLTSGVIELKLGPVADLEELGRRRSLLVRKMRGAPTDVDERPFAIVDGRGVVMLEARRPFTR
jgi:circadian clock protein KaiC